MSISLKIVKANVYTFVILAIYQYVTFLSKLEFTYVNGETWPRWESSTLAKSYFISVLIATIRNKDRWACDMARGPNTECLGRESNPSLRGGMRHSSKELFEPRVNSYSEHLHMSLRHFLCFGYTMYSNLPTVLYVCALESVPVLLAFPFRLKNI